MKTCETFTATIYVGLRGGGTLHLPQEVERICQEYCDAVGLCVTVTQTQFIYTGGNEPGCAVGLIKYPRFEPGYSEYEMLVHAVSLALRLLQQCQQRGVTIVTNNQSHYIDADTILNTYKSLQ